MEIDDPTEVGVFIDLGDVSEPTGVTPTFNAAAIIKDCQRAFIVALQARRAADRREAMHALGFHGGRLVAVTMALIAEQDREHVAAERRKQPDPELMEFFGQDIDLEGL